MRKEGQAFSNPGRQAAVARQVAVAAAAGHGRRLALCSSACARLQANHARQTSSLPQTVL
jgi:hypothetical protein